MSTSFYLRDAMLVWVITMALCPSVCVCLSQVDVRSIEMAERIGLVLAWELLSTYPTLCCKEIQVPSKIRVLPSRCLLRQHIDRLSVLST